MAIALLAAPLDGLAEPAPTLQVSATHQPGEFQLLDSSLELDVSAPQPGEDQFRPHKWLSHTVKNLDLSLANPDLDIGFSFDVRKRNARVKLGTFNGESNGFGVDTNVTFKKGRATLHTKVDLGLAGSRYKFELPEVSLIPRSHKGRRYIEYQVPVVRGNIDDVLEGISDPTALLDRLRFF